MTDWSQLVQQHGPIVWKTVYRLLNNDADAADCFQNTFVSALELSRAEAVRNWPGLLRRLATARALDRLRQRHREASRFTRMPESFDPAGEAAAPGRLAESQELAQELRDALAEADIRPVVEALRVYAEASGGHYPREERIGRDTSYDLCKMLSVEPAVWPEVRPKKGDPKNVEKAAKAIKGFDTIARIQAYNADAAYYGKTVGPHDQGNVLLRWQLDDGRYQIIFGDLRSETVTAERLGQLEVK